MQQVMRSTGIGERISFGGGGALGFAIGKAGDPDAWVQLTPSQQTWVTNTIVALDGKIRQQTQTTCPGMLTGSITGIAGCFQNWFNNAHLGFTGRDGSNIVLRMDGVFDQDTLDALRTVAAMDPGTFKTPFPGTDMPGLTGEKKKLSTGAMVGIATGGAAVLGGIVYVATRKGGKGRKARRR
jgi:hypothetical protein